MYHEVLPCRFYLTNMLAAIFYAPVQNKYLYNNLLCQHHKETPFYSELYAALHKLDPLMADEVALSLAY
jgi:hypothetical protein